MVRRVPPGRVTTYGMIAAFIGSPKAARMVGWALNKSGAAFPPVPAHRVVNRNGLLTGQQFFDFPGKMQELLLSEGIETKGNAICDFRDLCWNPAEYLDQNEFV